MIFILAENYLQAQQYSIQNGFQEWEYLTSMKQLKFFSELNSFDVILAVGNYTNNKSISPRTLEDILFVKMILWTECMPNIRI